MPLKRPQDTPGAAHAAKKSKPAQPSLASFFSPPSKPKPSASSSKPGTVGSQEEEDAKFARELAKSEGIDLEALRKEERWREQQQVKREVPTVVLDDGSDGDDCVVVESLGPRASNSSLRSDATPPPPGPLSSKPTDPPQHRTHVLPSTQTPSKQASFFAPAPTTSTSTSTRASTSLDTSIFTFSPASGIDTSSWPLHRIPFSFLVNEAFVPIAATKSRLTILRILTNLLRVVIELDPASLLQVIYLTTNRLGPPHEKDLELGIGSQVLGKAIRDVSGLSAAALKSLWSKLGDVGDVAFDSKRTIRLLIPPPPLVCHSVYTSLVALTKLKGSGSQASKTAVVKKLLVASQGEETRFVARILAQNLRIGAVRLTMTTALARAFCLSRPAGVAEDEYVLGEEEREGMARKEAARSGKGKGKGKEREVEEDEGGEKMEKAELLMRQVWSRHPDYGHILAALLSSGLRDLSTHVPLAVGTPLQPMLGSITRSLSDVYTRLSSRPFVAEAKLDGQRGQIHVALEEPAGERGEGVWYEGKLEGEKRIWARVFSRNLEDMSDKYPDLLPTLSAIMARESTGENPLTSFIIDSEICAIDPVTGALRSFQELSYRSRKDVELGEVKIRVGVFAFDLMFLNGVSLLAEPFRRRRELLRTRFGALQPADARFAKWELVPCSEENEPEKVQAFFQETLKMRAEGIMVKLLDEVETEEDLDADGESDSPTKAKRTNRKTLPASYEPDKRADSWLKVKKDYLDDLGDSLDLVPLGAWHGSGRKSKWWSPILLGCYDEETGGWSAVCKIMSGFTDAFYRDLYARFAPDSESTSTTCFPGVDAEGLKPAIWFKPSEVWEIRGADFTLSPVYPAARGIVNYERGISVRFPRFIRIRDPADKGIEQATSAEELAEMYRKQGDVGVDSKRGGEQEEEEEEES